ncbi:MAG: hypothetical protein JEZ06_02240 [Anaerolineaceae bacterium]|nr:hypothetical protein [Anaerolineaceae bacterium]
MQKIWKFGKNVDTDQIVPGRFAPYLRPDMNISDAAFIEAHPEFNQNAKTGDIIVADHNFGCGSSREYAPLALRERGIAAIISPVFARIFYRNAVNLGIQLFESEEIASVITQDTFGKLDLENGVLIIDEKSYPLTSSDPLANLLSEEGGLIAYIRKHNRFPILDEKILQEIA